MTAHVSGVKASAPTEREQTLADLLKQVAWRLPLNDPKRQQVADYLRREGLLGSPLRADDPGVPPTHGGQR